jgi:hypothetical protein
MAPTRRLNFAPKLSPSCAWHVRDNSSAASFRPSLQVCLFGAARIQPGWNAAMRALNLGVSFPAVRSRTRPVLADPKEPVAPPQVNDQSN